MNSRIVVDRIKDYELVKSCHEKSSKYGIFNASEGRFVVDFSDNISDVDVAKIFYKL